MTFQGERSLTPRTSRFDLALPVAADDEALIARQLGLQQGHLQRQGVVSADGMRLIAGLHAYGYTEGRLAMQAMLHQRNQAESQEEFDFNDRFAMVMGSQMVRNIADAAQRGSDNVKHIADQAATVPPPPRDNRPWLQRRFGG